MSTGFAEKEREFLASLKEDTGRDLAEWMTAISAQGLSGKNDIIDWLRQQGFMFWKASWLERIHHNAGKPIYADQPPVRPAAAVATAAPAMSNPLPSVTQIVTQDAATPAPVQPPIEPPATAGAELKQAQLDDLVARAKALRPLAQHLLREITRAVPNVSFAPRGTYISMSSSGEFAVLTISPRELRLGLALGDEPFDDGLTQSRFANPVARISTAMTHMVVLTDARQVNARLLAKMQMAADRAI